MGSRGPDFLVIGGQRSGTTWMSGILREHPRVFSLPIKELHYWDAVDEVHYSAGKRRFRHLKSALRAVGKGKVRDISWYLKYFCGPINDKYYQNLFPSELKEGFVCGDITPGYALLSDSVIKRIKKQFPGLKVIYIVRDPVDRAWSHLARRLAKKQGVSPDQVSATDYLNAIVNVPTVLEKSFHSDVIDRWASHFDNSKLRVLWFDDIKKKPGKFLDEFCDFYGIQRHDFKLEDNEPKNQSSRGFEMPPAVRKALLGLFRDEIHNLAEKLSSDIPYEWLRSHEAKLR